MTWEIDESRRKKEIVMAAMVRRERGGGMDERESGLFVRQLGSRGKPIYMRGWCVKIC